MTLMQYQQTNPTPEFVTGFFFFILFHIYICRPRQKGTDRGDGKCKREDRRVKGSGLKQIKFSVTEEQYLIHAKYSRCCSSHSLFHSSLLSLSLVAGSVKYDIRRNDSNMLPSELAAGLSISVPPTLLSTVLRRRNGINT